MHWEGIGSLSEGMTCLTKTKERGISKKGRTMGGSNNLTTKSGESWN